METQVATQKPQVQIMQVIQQTPPAKITQLDFVKNKFVDNYNLCHKDKNGELMYHRQQVFFNQQINSSDSLKNADPFSLYACFLTIAVKNYSLDPEDAEVYLFCQDGKKAVIKRQAGAHVRRLMETGQIRDVDQPKLVYKGDDFEVVNGRVVKHSEKFQSEEIVAGYVRFLLDKEGRDKFFIYRKSDWEAWKKKSRQASGDNWSGNNGQPGAAFLRTKLLLHAAKEKAWATGSTNPNVEVYSVEVDDDEDATNLPPATGQYEAKMIVTPAGDIQDDAFVESTQTTGAGITHNDDDF